MVAVGVKELKNELSAYLRRVGRGERVRITLRGKAIAELVPATRSAADDHLRELIAQGKVTSASAARPERDPRPERAPRSATAEILRERAEEG